ncbi:MAG: cadherin-like beta sandwich domain-containing protein [Lachnospiraceae bacterium]|nr:cadherin-like beta sandwich domain-containing protein [Candidatus Merdinaster equi]
MSKRESFNRTLAARVGIFFVIAVLAFLTFGKPVHAEYVNTWGTLTDGAKVRPEPNTDKKEITSLLTGARVEICGKVQGTGNDEANHERIWYKIIVDSRTTGYIRSDLIEDTGNPTGNTSPDDAANIVEETTQEPEETEPVTQVDTSLSDSTLHSLSISDGSINPAFDPAVTSYTIQVGEDVSALSVFGVPNTESGATIIDNSGFSELELGKNYGVITVQAADGTTQTYTFTVIRGEYQEESEENGESTGVTTGKQSSSGHTAVVVILVILLLISIVAIVILVLQNMNLRKMVDGGRGYVGSGLPDFKTLFGRIKDRFGSSDEENKTVYKKRSPISLKSLNKKPSITKDEDEIYEPDEDFDGGYSEAPRAGRYDQQDEVQYAYEDNGNNGIQDPGMKYSSISAALNSIKNVTAPSEHPAEVAFNNRNMEKPLEDEEEVFEPEGGYDLDDEDDEIEDILERNATVSESHQGDVWKPENFLTPRDDLEFEFLDIEDK